MLHYALRRLFPSHKEVCLQKGLFQAVDCTRLNFLSEDVRIRFSGGLTTKQVLFFGAFDEGHRRLEILRKALESQGFSTAIWNIKCNLWLLLLRFFWHSPRITRDALQSRFILIPYPGWRSLFLGKIISLITRRKLVFDAFFSNYNTFVEDRRYVHQGSLRAVYYLILDRLTCRLADVVLLDTYIHIDYFVNLLSPSREKFIRIFVGADIDEQMIRKASRSQAEPTTLLFVGTFIPLQGTKYIIEAADQLFKKGLQFRFIMVGMGQESEMIDSMIENMKLGAIVERHSFIPYHQLMELMNDVDICLGIFGETQKARRVIATKVFDYAAMNKVFITGESRAMAELFVEGVDYIGCPFGDSKELADKILSTISSFPRIRTRLNPRKKILDQATPEKIGLNLIRDLRRKGVL